MFNFLKNILGKNEANNEEYGTMDNNSRVSWNPEQPRPGDTVHVNYQGLLKNSGANEVYLHYGFDSWSKGITTVKMNRNENGDFGSDIPFNESHEINFCFRDNANNWDNNNGFNWTVHTE